MSVERVLMGLPVALALVDGAGRIRQVSVRLAALLGASAAVATTWSGRPWHELFSECTGIEGTHGTARVQRPQEAACLLVWSKSFLAPETGDLIVFQDLAASVVSAPDPGRYHLIFDSFPDAVFLAPLSPEGMHGNFVEVNEAALVRLGYTRAELLERNALSLNPPANRERTRYFGRTIQREGATVFEAVHVAKSGAHIPVEVTARILHMEGRDFVLS
ncbi:MAG TPA: PAS domain S-box protein, partial [Acidiferrobacteraceae bacterium]|nr:PAS domain S-box protein [Acidiferrobacteraceae bacterium]